MNKFCQFVRMRFVPPDPKHDAILKAAWESFSSYGYRKTSMDDIAKGAGMSRPALYVHFKNKDAICRALVAGYFYNAICDLHQALEEKRPLGEKLRLAFEAQAGALAESLLTSPHGHELLDVGTATGADQVADGEAELRGVYARWLDAEQAAGEIVLPADAEAVAATIVVALHGIKSGAKDYAGYLRHIEVFAKMTAAALTK